VTDASSPPPPAPPPSPSTAALPPGRVDIHSHLLPGVDDGCRDVDESLACVRELIARGFVASICTPHMAPECPGNTPAHATALTDRLQQQITAAGLTYRVLPGGELRLHEDVVPWMRQHGVPTLADSRCVLVDFWEGDWPVHIGEAFDWLLDAGYQPILAHPERIPADAQLDERLRRLESRGVWLQGNVRCYTGEEGYMPDLLFRQLLSEGRYRLLALDMHRLDSLPGRFDALDLLARDHDARVFEPLLTAAPRRDVLGTI
jgi:protein-tyrosine phosphatase